MTALAILFRLALFLTLFGGLAASAILGLELLEGGAGAGIVLGAMAGGALSTLIVCGAGAVLCEVSDDIATLRALAEQRDQRDRAERK